MPYLKLIHRRADWRADRRADRRAAARAWRRSTFCDAPEGACVEVAVGPDEVAVRDTKHDGGPVLVYTHREWRSFLNGVRNGEFELPAQA
jgi:hypothetical protein